MGSTARFAYWARASTAVSSSGRMGVHPTVHDFLGQELASQSSNSRLEPSSKNTWHTAACDGPPGTLRSGCVGPALREPGCLTSLDALDKKPYIAIREPAAFRGGGHHFTKSTKGIPIGSG